MSAPPVAVSLDLLYACNASCAFCGTHQLHEKAGFPDAERVTRIAETIGAAGVSVVGISGGEPLLSKHLESALRILSDYGVEIQLNTNGSLLAEWAERLIRYRVTSVTVSVDSDSAALHDQRRGVPGLHDRLEAGLEALGSSRSGHRVLRRVRFVVTPSSVGEVRSFVEKWRPRVDEVCLQPLMRHGHLLRGFVEADRHDAFRRPELEAELERLAQRYPEFRAPYYRGISGYVFGDSSAANSFDCVVPALMVQVTATGDVMLCTCEERLGNLLEEDLFDLWNHPRARALRDRSRRRCRTCFCYCQWLRANDSVPQNLMKTWIPARRSDLAADE